jgi:hypothetical protein
LLGTVALAKENNMAGRKLDRRGLTVLIGLTVLQTVIGTITVKDIGRRQPEAIRGPKLLWKLWGGSNTLGSAAYWLLGRRR